MEKIQAYLSLVDPRLLHHVKGKPGEFIHLFREKKYESEDAFAQRVCDGKHAKAHYRNLKSRTIRILQSLAVMSPSKGGSELKKNYDTAIKKFAVAQKLLNKCHRTEGIQLIKQIHEIAMAYDFVHLACETSSILYHDTLYYQADEDQAERYARQTEQFLADYTAEKKAQYLFYKLSKKANRGLRSDDCKKAIKYLSRYKSDSIRFKSYVYRLNIVYGLHMGDYPLVVKKCSEALEFFKGRKGVYRSTYQFFFQERGIARMALSSYADADHDFVTAMQYAPTNSLNEQALRYYQTLNALHSGKYQEAHDLFKQHKDCRVQRLRDEFAIIEAHLCFLTAQGYLELDQPFRMSNDLKKLLKTPLRKKRGNIALATAMLLVYLVRDRSMFIPLVKQVKKYSTRHRKSKGMARAKLFIKILSLMPKANFLSLTLQQSAKKHIQALQAHPISMGTNVAIEIIPYHILVEMMVGNGKSIQL
ncbi:MAG: hypothetical protein AAFV95_25060 [Bacteroidota bacterium]